MVKSDNGHFAPVAGHHTLKHGTEPLNLREGSFRFGVRLNRNDE